MGASCLQVDVSVASTHLNASASLSCSIGSLYFPLLVDEGASVEKGAKEIAKEALLYELP